MSPERDTRMVCFIGDMLHVENVVVFVEYRGGFL